MEDVRADMLDDALSKRAIEGDGGLTPRTCQSDVVDDAGVGINILHYKTRFPCKMVSWRSSPSIRSKKTYHAVLGREIHQMS
jgi:hypothetical protein